MSISDAAYRPHGGGMVLASDDGRALQERYAQGVAAHARGDYEAALHIFQHLAELGDTRAQFNIGAMHADGRGVPRNAAEAAAWYRRAAEHGNASAQFHLGIAYANGDGVPQDLVEAVRWTRLAAEQGWTPAQANLGVAYHNGLGVPKDVAEALKWFRLSAERGQIVAQYSLGNLHRLGVGVPLDRVEAYKWFALAIFHAGPLSEFQRGVRDLAIRYRDEIAGQMTAAQISEAERRAAEWKSAGPI